MPSIFIKPPLIDAYITRHRTVAKSMKFGYLLIGKHASSYFESIALWDLTSIPYNLDIISATANFFIAGTDATCSSEIEVYPIVSRWKPSSTSLRHPPFTSPEPIAVTSISSTSKVLAFGITPLVKEWQCHKDCNFGLLFRMKGRNLQGKAVSLFSGDYCVSTMWPYLEIIYSPPGAIPCIYKSDTINLSDTVTTTDAWSYSTPLDLLAYNYSYTISNIGANPAMVYLTISADGQYWVEESAKYTINPAETAVLVPSTIARYARAVFRSLNFCKETTLSIYVQGRTTL